MAKAKAKAAAADETVTVWVYRQAGADALGLTRMGIARCTRAQAEQLRAADQAQYMRGDGRLKWREGVVAGYPDPQPILPPAVMPVVSVTAISAANPAVATVSAGDMTKINANAATKVTLSGAAGTDAASINQQFTIGTKTATTFVLTGLDNSAPLVFTGLPLPGQLAK